MTFDQESITEVQIVGDAETSGIGSQAVDQLPALIQAAQSAEIDGISGATISSSAILAAAQSCINQAAGNQTLAPMTPGTYTAEVLGFNFEPVVVSVTVDENTITDIEIVEHDGNPGIGTEAAERLPQSILEAQSVNVDVISGATVTSKNILTCVTDALKQAGADIQQFSQRPAAAAKTSEVIQADVIIVGGGMAGISAAIEAANNQAKVVLLDKQSFLGGTTMTCGGCMIATGSEFNKDVDNDVKALADYWYDQSDKLADYNLIQLIAEQSGPAADFLLDLGVEFKEPSATGQSSALRALWTTVGGTYTNGGVGFIQPMVQELNKLGVSVYLDTRADQLLINSEGTVTGVHAQGKSSDYTFEGQAVILATGGFEGNKELFSKEVPQSEDIIGFGSAADQGDGILMAMEAGAATKYSGSVVGFRAVGEIAPSHKSKIGRIVFVNTPSVTAEGKRFVNETVDYPIFFDAMTEVVKETGNTQFYQVWDGDHSEIDLDLVVELGLGMKADTLEELSEKANMPELLQTIARYNEMAVQDGVDTDFQAQNIAPLDKAPYYLTSLRRADVGTYGGIQINLNSQVIRSDGTVIDGLFAAGECASGDFFGITYPGSGAMITFSAVTGRLAGTYAAQAAHR